MLLAKAIFLIFLYFKLGSSDKLITISIPDGNLTGQISTTVKNNATFYSFRGIPYAQPPIGNLRFANPKKNSPWNGTWNGTYDRIMCPQFAVDDLLGLNLFGDEDCLYISVYTPNYNASNLAVMVWIYGGAFARGNNSYESYKPDYFLEEGVIFVDFNYRGDAVGFLSTEDEACSGNWGIKDQILALKWVQENIQYFGGNPKNVTLFGESAGAASVHLLLQTPHLTDGLFHKAIIQSGSTLNLWSFNTNARSIALLIGENLGLSSTNTTELVETLRATDLATLMRIAAVSGWAKFFQNGFRGLPNGLVKESENVEGAVYLNNISLNSLENGNFARIPILIGHNSEEGVLAGGIPAIFNLYLDYYDVTLYKLPPWTLTQNILNRSLAGIEINNHYFQDDLIGNSNRQKFIKFISADQFNRPVRKTATLMAKHTTVYFYQYGYQGNVSVNWENRTYEGVGHDEELSYQFAEGYSNYSITDHKVSQTLVHLWTNFAKYGNPTPFEENVLLNNTKWDPVDPNSLDLNYLAINESISMQINPKQEDWIFYNDLWAKYGVQYPNITTY